MDDNVSLAQATAALIQKEREPRKGRPKDWSSICLDSSKFEVVSEEGSCKPTESAN